jgi:hypothetical protein
LPQIFMPLFVEVWEQYVPSRIQTWLKVIPTSLKNLANLLCDTEAGKALGEKAGQLGEDVLDVASSEVARQFWIDATVVLIKFFESLHTPEVKALLDQSAVGACRFVDVLSSGKAKQVWFDAGESLWALIEVVSDDVMVTSLADSCAQICFALENERESLKQRRSKGVLNQKDLMSRRRRERDQRQMEAYPPGKVVLRDGEGRDGFSEALMDSLGRFKLDEFDEQTYDGPPQRVIVPTISSNHLERGSSHEVDSAVPKTMHEIDNSEDSANNPNSRSDDSESEITTEIEDLQCSEDTIDHEIVHKETSESEKRTVDRRVNKTLYYEQDANGDYNEIHEEHVGQLHWQSNEDGAASVMHDTFDEPMLQFHRKINEVLTEARKQLKDVRHLRGDKQPVQDGGAKDDGCAQSKYQPDHTHSIPKESTGLFRFQRWKLIIIASLLCVATMCMIWFALGCYGLYILASGGWRIYQPLPILNNKVQHPSNIVIQIVTTESKQIANACDAAGGNGAVHDNDKVASITWDEWNKMKLGVERAIGVK